MSDDHDGKCCSLSTSSACSSYMTNFFLSQHLKSGSPLAVGQGTCLSTKKIQMHTPSMSSLTSCIIHVIPATQVTEHLSFQQNMMKLQSENWTHFFPPTSFSSSGGVLASTIIQYMQILTAQNSEQKKLAALQHLLDPDHQDPQVSRETFHSIMRDWIAQCSQDRLD